MKIAKTDSAVTPAYFDLTAPGIDIYSDTNQDFVLSPGETYMISTGLQIELPKNTFGVVYPKNNLHRLGLQLAQPIILDASSRGKLVIPIKNISSDIVRLNGRWGIKSPLCTLIIQQYRYERLEIEEEAIKDA